MKTILITMLLTPWLALAHSSFKYVDQTIDHWKGNDDPKLGISEMKIVLGGPRHGGEKWRFTEAEWTAKPASGYSCKKYSITFRVEDRKGSVVAEETKNYAYPRNGLSPRDYNKEASNVLFSGASHSAKFLTHFHGRTYLTIKYWLSDIHCEKF